MNYYFYQCNSSIISNFTGKTDRPACMPKGIPCTHQAKMGEGKDFLDKCPGKDPKKGLTAEMPLNHPFVRKPLPPTLPSMDHILSRSLWLVCVSLLVVNLVARN